MRTTRRAAITGELATIAARERQLLDALEEGDGTAEAIRTRLRDELGRRDTLTAELAQLATAGPVDAEALVRAAVERAADLRGLLARNIAQARQVVRQLLEGRQVCHPFEDAEDRGYAFTATGTYRRLGLPSFSKSVVAPTGFEPVFTVRHALSSSDRLVAGC
jgi:hypothetical protein